MIFYVNAKGKKMKSSVIIRPCRNTVSENHFQANSFQFYARRLLEYNLGPSTHRQGVHFASWDTTRCLYFCYIRFSWHIGNTMQTKTPDSFYFSRRGSRIALRKQRLPSLSCFTILLTFWVHSNLDAALVRDHCLYSKVFSLLSKTN